MKFQSLKKIIDELERGDISEDKSYKVGWLSSTLILFGSVCCIGIFGLEILKNFNWLFCVWTFFSRNFSLKKSGRRNTGSDTIVFWKWIFYAIGLRDRRNSVSDFYRTMTAKLTAFWAFLGDLDLSLFSDNLSADFCRFLQIELRSTM